MSEDREDLIRRLKAAEADKARLRYVQKVVDEAPPLAPEQIDRLRAVLRPVTNSEG